MADIGHKSKKFALENPIFLLENSSFLVFFDIPKNPDLGDDQNAVKHVKIIENYNFNFF